MPAIFKKFLTDESGATAIEYVLICSLIATILVAGLNAMGSQLNFVFNEITTALQ